VDGLGTGLQGKTLGIIGMGRIGQAVARRAALGFGMHVIYFNRSPVEGLAHPASQMPDIETVLQDAVVVSLHIPSAVDHQPIITEQRLALMKPTAHLINTARGTVVDEGALITCLQASHIAGAGLDVYENEPNVPLELRKLSNVTLLPHIGSATVEFERYPCRMGAFWRTIGRNGSCDGHISCRIWSGWDPPGVCDL
jgi:lactate dehydrogenase-like 2-hydroxyacid dehydrogenase